MSSYVKISSAIVRERAQSRIQWIKKIRDQHLENAIKEEIERSKNSWLRKLFRLPVITRDEALERLKSCSGHRFFSDYDEIMMAYGRLENNLCMLLQAASLASDMLVSTEDVEDLNL